MESWICQIQALGSQPRVTRPLTFQVLSPEIHNMNT